MASVFLALLESLGLIFGLVIIAAITPIQSITDLYLLTPTDNSANILQWVNETYPSPPIVEGRGTLGLWESVAVLGFWVILMVGLSVFSFQRQDIQ